MGNLKAAFDKAQLTAADRSAQRATEQAKGGPLKPSQEVLTDGSLLSLPQVHCYDPWVIVRVISGSERRARASLERDGLEVFYPVGRNVKRLPMRFIPPKKRKGARKHGVLIIDIRNPYPGYVFCRRLVGNKRSMELSDLDGVIGVCMFGEELATIPDWRLEMLRVAQDCGDYDRLDPAISIKEFNLAEFRYTKAAASHWSKKPRVVGRLDSTRAMIHFVEEFGRITRVVAAAGDQQISPIVDATALK